MASSGSCASENSSPLSRSASRFPASNSSATCTNARTADANARRARNVLPAVRSKKPCGVSLRPTHILYIQTFQPLFPMSDQLQVRLNRKVTLCTKEALEISAPKTEGTVTREPGAARPTPPQLRRRPRLPLRLPPQLRRPRRPRPHRRPQAVWNKPPAK